MVFVFYTSSTIEGAAAANGNVHAHAWARAAAGKVVLCIMFLQLCWLSKYFVYCCLVTGVSAVLLSVLPYAAVNLVSPHKHKIQLLFVVICTYKFL